MKSQQSEAPNMRLTGSFERREFRRHDFEHRGVAVFRWDGPNRPSPIIGHIVDISAGGIRIRTNRVDLRPDQQIRVRVSLPAFAGIHPFIDTSGRDYHGSTDWVGWISVTRTVPVGLDELDVAGKLIDMDEMDRGMLALYLSTQPLAA